MNSPRWRHYLSRLSTLLGHEQALSELRWMRQCIPRELDEGPSDQKLDSMVRRRMSGEPLQYILGMTCYSHFLPPAYFTNRDSTFRGLESPGTLTCLDTKTRNRGLDDTTCTTHPSVVRKTDKVARSMHRIWVHSFTSLSSMATGKCTRHRGRHI